MSDCEPIAKIFTAAELAEIRAMDASREHRQRLRETGYSMTYPVPRKLHPNPIVQDVIDIIEGRLLSPLK